MIDDKAIIGLARAIYHWLNYHSNVTKTKLLAESSVRYSIAEYLERNLNSKVELEFPHPIFPSKRLDFKFTSELGNGFIEVKYVQASTRYTSEKQRFFNDLIRLASLDSSNDRLFILCGPTDDYKLNFKYLYEDGSKRQDIAREAIELKKKGLELPATGFYSSLFPFEGGTRKDIIIENFGEYTSRFESKYDCNLKQKISHFSTKLVTTQVSNYSRQMVNIWRVI